MRGQIPIPQNQIASVALFGGSDLTSSPSAAKPGLARGAVNYEAAFTGGFQRIGGFERFDGRPRPSDAVYEVLDPETSFSGVVVGDTINGATSGSTAVVVYIDGYLAATKKSADFTLGETLRVGVAPIGVLAASSSSITPQRDNVLAAAAADSYRADITTVPGSGQIRGLAALGSTLYAWRDNAGGTAMAIYKSTIAGWVEVPRYYEFEFSNGTAIYADGGTLTKGGVTATIKRVVLESGTWGSSAAGRMITTLPTGGNFTAGVAAGSGACTLVAPPATSALAQITFQPGGRVETEVWNFYGSTDTRRLYGCDGVNREFEFDGDVWVPLKTGMTVRASFVRAHKNFLFFAFRGSMQHSSPGNPYTWSAVLGAAELGMGDTITGLVTTAGSQDSAAMVVTCKDSTQVLYGTGSASWQLVALSRNAGANAYSMQDIGSPIGHDMQGFRIFSPTTAFGNFNWNLVSRQIDPIARERTPVCSVFSSKLSRYRIFFDNGEALSGTPVKGGVAWTQIQYGKPMSVAYEGEIDGEARVFYGGEDGFVYEADVGRSFDGGTVQAVLKLLTITMGSPMLIKQFRAADLEVVGEGYFTLYSSAEFDDGDPDVELTSRENFALRQISSLDGYGGQWDATDWDASRWDSAAERRQRLEFVGRGYGIAPIFFTEASNELPHTIKSMAFIYSSRNLKRS